MNVPNWRWMLAALTTALVIVPGAADADDSGKPPRGAIVLFDGKSLDAWKPLNGDGPVQWVVRDGTLQVKEGSGNIVTKLQLGDYRLHVEFMEPLMPDKHSQERGNSGVYNQGRYEVQVLDSYMNDTYPKGGCGAIYGVKDPDRNMSKPPLEWQTYDITFRAPRFDPNGKLTERPRISVIWNGVKVHDDVEIPVDFTTAGMDGPVPATGPIMLQDHGSPVKFRNIWVVLLKPSLIRQ